jgi:hypothetical protein
MVTTHDVIISQDMSIVKPAMKRVALKERYNDKIILNEIKMDEKFEFGMDELKVAVNDNKMNIGKSNMVGDTRPYNLSSSDRKNMQSREDYRRNNLRPNGKPYF